MEEQAFLGKCPGKVGVGKCRAFGVTLVHMAASGGQADSDGLMKEPSDLGN